MLRIFFKSINFVHRSIIFKSLTIIDTELKILDAVGQDVLRQAQIVKNLFELQREFILISTGHDFNDGNDPHSVPVTGYTDYAAEICQ